jgi:hypothetical protein
MKNREGNRKILGFEAQSADGDKQKEDYIE